MFFGQAVKYVPKSLELHRHYNLSCWTISKRASVAELVDAVDSKSTDRKVMGVRFSPEAPNNSHHFSMMVLKFSN
jgi:hypothetical protein